MVGTIIPQDDLDLMDEIEADDARLLPLAGRLARQARLQLPANGYYRFQGAEYHEREICGTMVLTRNGFPVDENCSTEIALAFIKDLKLGALDQLF